MTEQEFWAIVFAELEALWVTDPPELSEENDAT